MDSNSSNINQVSRRPNSPSVLNVFSDDSSFVFIIKKTEKLISALYMITGFFTDQEPLKWRLRTLGFELMNATLALNGSFGPKREKCVADVQAKIIEILSLLSVAKNAGLISDMNHSIIDREYNAFAESLMEKVEVAEPVRSRVINPEAFVVPEERKPEEKPVEKIKDKTDELPTELSGHVPKTTTEEVHKGQIINEEYLAGGPQRKRERSLKEFGAVSVKKNSRQSIIIGLLKRKKEIMIKDVSPLISGCSEKTIQRELLAMVKEGILKKEGEKRWSRYSLA